MWNGDHNGPVLAESDVRAIVRLLSEVAASRKDHSGMKRMLMDGVCNLISAETWVWALGCRMTEGKPPIYVSLMHGGFDEDRFARYLTAVEHPDTGFLTHPIIRELREKQRHVTRLRQHIVTNERFCSSEAYPFWNRANIGPLILSFRPLDEHSASGIGLYRGRDAPLFTQRESRIAHIILSEVPWLHEQGWPEDRGATVPILAPRERLVLHLLLDGRSRKDISNHLALSENTVSGYQKTIYRHFGVNSHAALMRRFQQGDGGDQV